MTNVTSDVTTLAGGKTETALVNSRSTDRGNQASPFSTKLLLSLSWMLKCRHVVCLGARIEDKTLVGVNLSFTGSQRTLLIKEKEESCG